MIIDIKNKSNKPQEGLALMKIIKIEEGDPLTTEYGTTSTIIATLEQYGADLVGRYKRYDALVFEGSRKLLKLFEAVLGEVPEELDTEDLIGKDCVAQLKINKKGDKTYVNIVDLHHPSQIQIQDLINGDALASKSKRVQVVNEIDLLFDAE
jgi:hypothetical protein